MRPTLQLTASANRPVVQAKARAQTTAQRISTSLLSSFAAVSILVNAAGKSTLPLLHVAWFLPTVYSLRSTSTLRNELFADATSRRIASPAHHVKRPQTAGPAQARYEGVNRPDLLPSEPNVTVIDVAGFLTDGEEKRLKSLVASLEKATGIKLRILAQNYPDTPGLAIKDYWKVDDTTVVFVADPTFANLVNVNVGGAIDLSVPQYV